MIALFLGEFYRFRTGRRVALVFAAIGLSFLFNVGRTFLLVFVAAKQGQSAMEKWHDPAGVTILVGCFSALWALAHFWSQPPQKPIPVKLTPAKFPRLFLASVAGCAVIAEAGTELWYRAHESSSSLMANWSVSWPRHEKTFTEDKISKDVREIMNFDEGQAVRWLDGEGYAWRAYYFCWRPANSLQQRVKIQAAKGHRPDICLRAVGLEMKQEFGLHEIKVGKFSFPFQCYRFESQGSALYVFYSAWEDGVESMASVNMREDSVARVKAALAGTRGLGQRMLEFIISGVGSATEAQKLLERNLGLLIQHTE